MKSVEWPCRMEVLSKAPLVVCDGAHNPYAAATLRDTLPDYFDYRRVLLVVGVSRDKNMEGIVGELAGLTSDVIVTRSRHPRAATIAAVAVAFAGYGVDAVQVEGVDAAVAKAVEESREGDLVLVTGSLFVAAEARETVLGIEPELYPELQTATGSPRAGPTTPLGEGYLEVRAGGCMNRRRVVITGLGSVTPPRKYHPGVLEQPGGGKVRSGAHDPVRPHGVPLPGSRGAQGLRPGPVHGLQGGPPHGPVLPACSGRGPDGRRGCVLGYVQGGPPQGGEWCWATAMEASPRWRQGAARWWRRVAPGCPPFLLPHGSPKTWRRVNISRTVGGQGL